jgi:hypothetical protein
MKSLAMILVAAGLLFGGAAQAAEEISPDVQVKLQNAMQTHLESISVGGAYTFLSDATELQTLYPANTHPMVLTFGDDYFVCSDMVDANGQSTTADFLVRKIGDSYHVVQMLVGERPLVEAAMKKMGQ